MNVKLLAHTGLSVDFFNAIAAQHETVDVGFIADVNERAALALTAIRTCYSPLKPTEVLPAEGVKYFDAAASDGGEGSDADRLFRHVVRSKHTSTLEHITYTFAIEGVSRSLLAQITRHRKLSFSVQSQRYVRFGSGDKSGGFGYLTPPSVSDQEVPGTNRYDDDVAGYRVSPLRAYEVYEDFIDSAQKTYDALRSAGVPAEDARFVLPNAAACNFVMTGNLRALLEFYGKRRPGNGAQWELAALAGRIREEIVKVDPWTEAFFKEGTA